RTLGEKISACNAAVELHFELREPEAPDVLAERWRREAAEADPVEATLLDHWAAWAVRAAGQGMRQLTAWATLHDWGGLPIIGLPGEIFASTALSIRKAYGPDPLFIAGFAEDNPGYIPPREEYAFGGYEVEEAHRYYGQPAAFAPG